MSQTQNNNKRIAKNTLLLYLRMIFLLSISLFTSRVVLQTLGVEDYGIYNVVGGVVALFAFLNGAMTGATQRYLNFDLAKNDTKALSETFNTALIIHSLIALTLILLSETVGLWFMYEKMVIPEERMTAAMWVLQCAILVMSVNIISVPYNAAIIAHEKMGAFAYISLLEATLKLLIVYMLYISPVDKLILYAILLLTVSVVIRFVYSSYSHKHFKETHFRFIWNTVKLKEMGAFASWNLIGNLALMGVTQGLNMLLNVFFGPVVNAARGVAVQVQGAIQQFANNFQTAINPQITKSYASNQLEYMHSLICRGAKFSFFYGAVHVITVPYNDRPSIGTLAKDSTCIYKHISPDYTVERNDRLSFQPIKQRSKRIGENPHIPINQWCSHAFGCTIGVCRPKNVCQPITRILHPTGYHRHSTFHQAFIYKRTDRTTTFILCPESLFTGYNSRYIISHNTLQPI